MNFQQNLELRELYKWAAAPEVFHSQSQAQPSQSLYDDACSVHSDIAALEFVITQVTTQ